MAESPKNYAWNVDDYSKHSLAQYMWAKELIPKLKLCVNETILDIACGDGKVTAVLAKCLPKGCVVGVDSSEEMISLALHTIPQEVYPIFLFKEWMHAS